jgi:hypothetical protein
MAFILFCETAKKGCLSPKKVESVLGENVMEELMTKKLHTTKVTGKLTGCLPGGLMADHAGSKEKPESLISASMEEIHNRADIISPLLQELLERRPPPHWGLNE